MKNSSGTEEMNERAAFSIVQPYSSVCYDDVRVSISKPNIEYQIENVIVKIGDRQAKLKYSDSAYFESIVIGRPGWVGDINVDGLRGEYDLEVCVTDIMGNKYINKKAVRCSKKPEIIINSPKEDSFFKGYLELDIEAKDSAGQDCDITVSLDDRQNKISGKNKINEVLDCSKRNYKITMTVEALNEDGVRQYKIVEVYVDNSKYIKGFKYIDGDILDYRNDDILYIDNKEKNIIIKNLTTGIKRTVYTCSEQKAKGVLLQNGKILLQIYNDGENKGELLEYFDGSIYDLGKVDKNSLKVNGDYYCWSNFNKVNIKNIVTNEVKVIDNEFAVTSVDVDRNGDMAWCDTTSRIFTCRDGSIENLNRKYSGKVYDVAISEKSIIYSIYISGDEYSVVMNINNEENVVGSARKCNFEKGGDYIGYDKMINGNQQVFLIKNGVQAQATFFEKNSFLESISENGDVVVNMGDHYSTTHCLIKNGAVDKIEICRNEEIDTFWKKDKLYGIVSKNLIEFNVCEEENQKPNIIASDVTIKMGDSYNPLYNVKAFDNEDGDITNKIKIISNTVDKEKVGSYEITYLVSDSQGETVTKKIKVIVRSNEKPVISASDLSITLGDEFEEKNYAHAYDNEDGDISSKISIDYNNLNTEVVGQYKIIYSVIDSDGNKSIKEIIVIVKPKEEHVDYVPEIIVKDMIIELGKEFNPLNIVQAIDNEDGDITGAIRIVENTIDVMKEGVYKVIYEVVDSYGNRSTKEVEIKVCKLASGELGESKMDESSIPSTRDNNGFVEIIMLLGSIVILIKQYKIKL